MTDTIGAQSRMLLAALDINVVGDARLNGDIQRAREVVECLRSDSGSPAVHAFALLSTSETTTRSAAETAMLPP